jgi:ribosome maturation factor RimP
MRLADQFKSYHGKTIEVELNTATTLYGTVSEAHEDHVVIVDRSNVPYIVTYNSIVHFYEILIGSGSSVPGSSFRRSESEKK